MQVMRYDCSLQGPTATLGIYVDAGSVHEKPMQSGEFTIELQKSTIYGALCDANNQPCAPGTSHLLEYMAFKTSLNRSHFRLVREVRTYVLYILAAASLNHVFSMSFYAVG